MMLLIRQIVGSLAARIGIVSGTTLAITGLLILTSRASPNADSDAALQAAADAALQAAADAALQSVVVIYRAGTEEKREPSGAGFFITSDGYLLTASHVVEQDPNKYKGATFNLKLKSGKELDARLIGRSEDLDVALLKIVTPTEIRPLPLKEGSTDMYLAILGHPSGDRPKLFDRTYSKVSDPDRYGLEALNPALDPGYSGGPVIDGLGSVVAIALQQGEYTPVAFVRRIDTLNEFLEANGIVQGRLGYEKHLSLSSLATIEQVGTLEKELNDLKEEEINKQKLIDDMTRQLWNLKSQVQWNLSICEIPSASKEPKHRLAIEYTKASDIMFDAVGTFTARIMPLMAGDGESPRGLAEARKRKLYVPKSFTFDGQKWNFDQLDEEVQAHVQTYNETRDPGIFEVDGKNIHSLVISLTPPKGDDEMQFFRFADKPVKYAGADKCVEQ